MECRRLNLESSGAIEHLTNIKMLQYLDVKLGLMRRHQKALIALLSDS